MRSVSSDRGPSESPESYRIDPNSLKEFLTQQWGSPLTGNEYLYRKLGFEKFDISYDKSAPEPKATPDEFCQFVDALNERFGTDLLPAQVITCPFPQLLELCESSRFWQSRPPARIKIEDFGIVKSPFLELMRISIDGHSSLFTFLHFSGDESDRCIERYDLEGDLRPLLDPYPQSVQGELEESLRQAATICFMQQKTFRFTGGPHHITRQNIKSYFEDGLSGATACEKRENAVQRRLRVPNQEFYAFIVGFEHDDTVNSTYGSHVLASRENRDRFDIPIITEEHIAPFSESQAGFAAMKELILQTDLYREFYRRLSEGDAEIESTARQAILRLVVAIEATGGDAPYFSEEALNEVLPSGASHDEIQESADEQLNLIDQNNSNLWKLAPERDLIEQNFQRAMFPGVQAIALLYGMWAYDARSDVLPFE
ncbi:MAG: hypothetical protein KDD60_10475 [Bdellovibrionales bacterium]|nr:hypothetical protein [Bdellovibrionales bacterium]